jgi:hypothetical protein
LSVGSSSEVNSPVSFKPTENIEDTVEELNEIMEILNLGNHRVTLIRVPMKALTITQ